MNINTDKVRKKDQSIIVDFYFDSTLFYFVPKNLVFRVRIHHFFISLSLFETLCLGLNAENEMPSKIP